MHSFSFFYLSYISLSTPVSVIYLGVVELFSHNCRLKKDGSHITLVLSSQILQNLWNVGPMALYFPFKAIKRGEKKNRRLSDEDL